VEHGLLAKTAEDGVTSKGRARAAAAAGAIIRGKAAAVDVETDSGVAADTIAGGTIGRNRLRCRI
jgi:hypothetical protein